MRLCLYIQQPVTSTETVLQEVEEFPINIEHRTWPHAISNGILVFVTVSEI